MDKKLEEMIASGAAYAVNCQPCMEVHKRKAIEAGLTEREMRAAIQVAEAVKAGASKKSRDFAESLFGNVKEERCCPADSECRP
jgi:AhpD family alkylhydroperoxidase